MTQPLKIVTGFTLALLWISASIWLGWPMELDMIVTLCIGYWAGKS